MGIFSSIFFFAISSPLLGLPINSQERTVQRQAELMCEAAKRKDLRRLYVNTKLANDVQDACKISVEAAREAIQAAVDKKVYISAHLCGDAVDISTRKMSEEHVNYLMFLLDNVVNKDIKYLYHSGHLHIQKITFCN